MLICVRKVTVGMAVCLCMSMTSPTIGTVFRIVVPKQFRPFVLNLAHRYSGHLGIAKVRALLAPFYTWPGIHRDVRAANHIWTPERLNRTLQPELLIY